MYTSVHIQQQEPGAHAEVSAMAAASKPQTSSSSSTHEQQHDACVESSSLFPHSYRHTRSSSDLSDVLFDSGPLPTLQVQQSDEEHIATSIASQAPFPHLHSAGARPTSARSLGDQSPLLAHSDLSDQAIAHALADIEGPFQHASLMSDSHTYGTQQQQQQGNGSFPGYDDIGYSAMQSPPLTQQQQQVPQFSLSQQNQDGTMTTLHTVADGADLAPISTAGHRISRHASPFETAGSPLQPPAQLAPSGLHFGLQDPFANGLDVPSPYSDTASFVGSDFGDHGSPHLDMLALSRTTSSTSAFRPDMGFLYSHPSSPYADHFDASANQPPPPHQQQQQANTSQRSFNFLQPQQAQGHQSTGTSPQMAHMAFTDNSGFPGTVPVAIPLEQPGSAYGEYTPGISLNPPTPSAHSVLGLTDLQGPSTFSYMQSMPLITTSHHHNDVPSDVSNLERALQEQQQKQLEQLRQHHLQQQQSLLGVEEAARRGRSHSDSGMQRFSHSGSRDHSRGSSRGRSRESHLGVHGHRGSSSGSLSPHAHANATVFQQAGAFPGSASVVGATSGLLGSDLRALSPNPRSSGPGGKHVRRSSWSGQRHEDGLSPRAVSPSGSSVRSYATSGETPKQAPHAKAKNPATFICPVAGCSKAFTRAYNLRSHQRTHTNERPFLCEVCGKAFARQHDRKRHEALHSGVKAHACPGCNKKFARMDALSRHFKSETGKDCIEGREEYALYVDGQANAEQMEGSQGHLEDDDGASQDMSELGLDFGGEVYDEQLQH